MPEWCVYSKQISPDPFISAAYSSCMLLFSLPYYDGITCSKMYMAGFSMTPLVDLG